MSSAIERHILGRGKGLSARMQATRVAIVDENIERAFETEGLNYLEGTRNWVKYNKIGKIFIVQYRNEPEITKRRQTKFQDVEHAIRGTGYIKDDYDIKEGNAAQQTREVMAQVRSAARAFQRPGLTNEDIVNIAIDTADTLVGAGFSSARDRDKKKIAGDLMHAQGLDRLGRVNPSRNRLMNAHPYIDLERRLLIVNEIGTKYQIINGALIRERTLERVFIEEAADYMERVSKLRPGIREPISRELPGLREFIFDYLSPRAVHLAPYTAPAAAVRYLIIGHMNDIAYLRLQEYLGPDMAKRFIGQKQFGYLTVPEVQVRLKMCASALRDVLEFGDRNLVKENKVEEIYIPKLPFLAA